MSRRSPRNLKETERSSSTRSINERRYGGRVGQRFRQADASRRWPRSTACSTASIRRQVRTALANIEKASENANKAAADIAKVTEQVRRPGRRHRPDRSRTPSELAQRLNDASVRVDGILAKVDKLLGSGEAEGVMADARETLKSFKQVADTLNCAARRHHRRSGAVLRARACATSRRWSRTAAARSTGSRRRSPISSAIRSASLSGGDGDGSPVSTAGRGVDIRRRRAARNMSCECGLILRSGDNGDRAGRRFG